MNGRSLLLAALSVLWMAPPVAHAAGDAARGAVIVRVRCSACHFIHRHEHKLGPSLYGIYDRAPTIRGVPFKRWDAKALDAWLSGPRRIKLNTTMVLPPLPPQDRQDVIAYFAQQKAKLMTASAVAPDAP